MVDIPDILREARTIAVVGLSPMATRPSHRIADYLRSAGYRIVPVNPHHKELLGERAYATLLEIPDPIRIDIVDIFRRPQFTAGIVRDAIARRDRLKAPLVIWTQIGVSSPEAEQLATQAGIPYVRNRCTLVEHSRFLG